MLLLLLAELLAELERLALEHPALGIHWGNLLGESIGSWVCAGSTGLDQAIPPFGATPQVGCADRHFRLTVLRHDRGEPALEEHADQLRRGYAAFAEGDLAGAMEFFAEDIRWQGPRTNGLPDSGTFHGKDEVAWMFKQLVKTYGEDLRVVPDEFIQDGSTIVVLGHLEASPGGAHLKVPWVHVWRFEQESAARVLTLTDTAMVRDALSA